VDDEQADGHASPRDLWVARVMLHLPGSGQSGKASKTVNLLNLIASQRSE
jgi:hypothetical protein